MPAFINNPVPASVTSAHEIGAAIRRACIRRGWQMEPSGRGSGVATYHKGRLMAALNLSWTARDYSMSYRNSRGFGYQPKRNAIHPRFVHWFRRLRHTINKELQRTGARR
jgi:hypothetical protein